MNQVNHAEVRNRMRMHGITQYEVARLMGLSGHTTLNQWLNGTKEMPEDFGRRAEAVVNVLERANKAAAHARSKVIEQAGIN